MTDWPKRFATCFGIGWTPLAPGTAASMAALPLGWLFLFLGWKVMIVLSLVATIFGIWACGVYAEKIGVNDPSECVLDEVVGQWIALLPIAMFASAGWRPYVVAFLLFRLFDMWKPWPIYAFEKLPGGLGIMLDDVVAGVFAALLLCAILAIDLV